MWTTPTCYAEVGASGLTGECLKTDLCPPFGLASPRSLRDAARTAAVLPRPYSCLMFSALMFLLAFSSLS